MEEVRYVRHEDFEKFRETFHSFMIEVTKSQAIFNTFQEAMSETIKNITDKNVEMVNQLAHLAQERARHEGFWQALKAMPGAFYLCLTLCSFFWSGGFKEMVAWVGKFT